MSDPTEVAASALQDYITQINTRRRFTNRGPLVEQLEFELGQRIGGDCHVSLVTSGTTALICALRAAGVHGEVITTPYTYIATAASIVWAGCRPVFADVVTGGFNICAESVSTLITPNTSAILAVHCYGEPCNDKALRQIADRHDIRLIYDAAHVCDFVGEPSNPLWMGDLAVVSLHATKVLHAVEGGFVISRDADTKKRIDQIAGFGFENECTVSELGLNGRMSEIHAAVGLVNLGNLEAEITARQRVISTYFAWFSSSDCLSVPASWKDRKTNLCSYFPLRIRKGQASRDALHTYLQYHRIESRRYFFPLVSEFGAFSTFSQIPCYEATPEAFGASREVLCLPVHGRMTRDDAERVASIVVKFVDH
jgi:dTDP-4-amino-4,6-dideoxy-D-glucose transaminase